MNRIVILLILSSFLFLTGCECLGGLGRDMQKAGQWVEEEAKKAK